MSGQRRQKRLGMVAQDCAKMALEGARKLPRHFPKSSLKDGDTRRRIRAESLLALASAVFVAVMRDGSVVEARDQGEFVSRYVSELARKVREFRIGAKSGRELAMLIGQAADDYALAVSEMSEGNSIAFGTTFTRRASLTNDPAVLIAEIAISIEVMSFYNVARDFIESAVPWATSAE